MKTLIGLGISVHLWIIFYFMNAVTGSTLFKLTKLTAEYLQEPALGLQTVNPRLSWQIQFLNSFKSQRGLSQESYHIQVATRPDFEADTYDCGRVESSQSSLVSLKCGGMKLHSDTNYFWRVKVTLNDGSSASSSSRFHIGLLTAEDWTAKWITGGNTKTLLRSSFNAPVIENHAFLFVSGIGYNEIYLNGEKVGDHKLDPGWTDYAKRVYYSTYDLTDALLEGENVIGVSLGNGWWSCGLPPYTSMPPCSSSPPQLLLQLQVDGKVVINSNEKSWRVSAGPIVYNSLYNGEIFDSRVHQRLDGWSSNNFDDSGWSSASLAMSEANNATPTSQLFDPIRHISTRDPVSITSPSPGVQVIDFGQNQAAVINLKHFFCERGSNVTMRHAEILNHPPYGPADGRIYVDNLRSARATDIYICKGDKVNGESYTPTFTQHGFRYVEITGLSHALQERDIQMIELHTDVQQTSSIDFSIPLLNQIQQLVIWGQKSNLMSVPTDCPNRDERRGWLGDASLTAEEAATNFNMGSFYNHFLLQVSDAQAADGSVPNFVPSLGTKDGSPNWESAFPVIIWTVLQYYGDYGVVYRHHDALVRYYDYFESNYNMTGIKQFISGFGDWVPPSPHPMADGHLVGAFAFLHDLHIGLKLFQASIHPNANVQIQRCKKLITRLSKEYHEAFFNKTSNMYLSGLQTEQTLPLILGVAPKSADGKVLSYLIEDIQITNSGHTTSGIIGIKFLMELLSLRGRSDVALDLALQTSYPSWGYMIYNENEPATTLWELWNSNKAGPSMNSRNHIMFGSVSSWFYKFLAGITPTMPGFRRLSIKPTGIGHSNLTHVDAKIVTPYGDVLSFWKIEFNSEQQSILYTHIISLPPGVEECILLIPINRFGLTIGSKIKDRDFPIVNILESEIPIWKNRRFLLGNKVEGVKSGKVVDDGIQFTLFSGQYTFKCIVSQQSYALE